VAITQSTTIAVAGSTLDDEPGTARAFWLAAENRLSVAILAAMTLLPLAELTGRTWFGRGIPGAFVVTQQLTLWIALAGAALAARSERLLALSTPMLMPERWRARARILTSAVGAGVSATLVIASLDLVRIERAAGETGPWGIPAWLILAILPAGFTAIAGRLVWQAADRTRGRALAALGLLVPLAFADVPALQGAGLVWPATLAILAATVLGMPIFAAIGGAALFMYWADGTPINAVPVETYRLTTSELLPAIPLFALSGYILAEGGASARLTRLLTALFGWLPGGLAIVVTGVLAFFTPLTGASGVTIVSMGGLLGPVLVQARYSGRSALGLVTVAGSIGLLFFPSLPVFLYGFYTNQPFERLFIGGLLPGILLVAVVAGYAAVQGWRGGTSRTPFRAREAAAAIWLAKWDLFFPAVILSSIAMGWASGLLEAAALSVLYAAVIECLVHRTLSGARELPRLAVECATLVGGFLIILSVALAFTNYLILADVPAQAIEWVRHHIASPAMFLLALNFLLLVAGALMDIYSATVVVVPLIAPIAAAYGIDPVHLCIIFLANMELGYLTPPMGENLFLSSYRFNRPLSEVYRSTLPFTVMIGIAVLLITYVPELTLWLVRWYDARVGS
jgi:C4-dicarboxylate transporter, DctM subunit